MRGHVGSSGEVGAHHLGGSEATGNRDAIHCVFGVLQLVLGTANTSWSTASAEGSSPSRPGIAGRRSEGSSWPNGPAPHDRLIASRGSSPVQLDAVVGRARCVGRGDRRLSLERPNWRADELKHSVVGKLFDERAPIPGPDGSVEESHMLVQVHGESVIRAGGPHLG